MPWTRYQNPSPGFEISGSVAKAFEVPLIRHTSSPPPGPTGSALTRPRNTSDQVEPSAGLHEIVAIPAICAIRTLSSTSAGDGLRCPRQMPPLQASLSVHALPSSHAIPSVAVGFEQTPVAGLHVPAS